MGHPVDSYQIHCENHETSSEKVKGQNLSQFNNLIMALNTPQQLLIYTLCPHNFNSFRLQSIFRYNVSLWKNLPFENRTSHEKHLHSDLTKMEGKEEVYVIII